MNQLLPRKSVWATPGHHCLSTAPSATPCAALGPLARIMTCVARKLPLPPQACMRSEGPVRCNWQSAWCRPRMPKLAGWGTINVTEHGDRTPLPAALGCNVCGLCLNQSTCRHLFASRVGPLAHRRDGPMLALTFRVPVCPPGETHSPRASGTPQRTLDIRQRFSLGDDEPQKRLAQSQQNLMPPAGRFPPPWSVEEQHAHCVVRRSC
jgi:hypothetical protein